MGSVVAYFEYVDRPKPEPMHAPDSEPAVGVPPKYTELDAHAPETPVPAFSIHPPE